MSVNVHPTAIVGAKAILGEGTKVGAYAVIEDGVTIGANCDIQNHTVIRSHTRIGDDVQVFPFAVLGAIPQHLGFKGEDSTVTIGNRVLIREGVTVHRGTALGRGDTTIGDECYLMAYSHVAHDCKLGRNVILVNSVLLGGHVEIGDFATLGGGSAVGQNCRVGMYAYLGGHSAVRKDVTPFVVGKGGELEIQGINIVGLGRRGFNSETISRLKKIYKIFYLQGLTVAKSVETIVLELGETDEVKVFVDFVKGSKMGFVR